MRGRAWLKGVMAAAIVSAGALASAQVVGSVNGSALGAMAFHEDSRSAFLQHQAGQGDADLALASRALAFSTTTNVQRLAELGVVAADWAQQLPHHAAPTISPVVFIVRAGNPRGVHDWADLVRRDVALVLSNPKHCNTGRYAYFGAWGSVLDAGGSAAQAEDFVAALFGQAQLVARSEREAVSAFAAGGAGDVLVAFESEIPAIRARSGAQALQVVYPPVSVAAENAVALSSNDAGASRLAKAYLDYLYSDEAQEIAARHYLRPRSAAVLARHADRYQALKLFSVQQHFGSLERASREHFADGGRFDQLYAPRSEQWAARAKERAAAL
ncbi:sulfate ABC transporter substrate-binding protein [Comamonas sp. NLF-1-9]|uniref:sulfate ABC transporter substrate-binding protein n=1 Tax=Comamonas sp. NLF-1-9 TaxID=2853163 RepID=UPI001C455F75|nr:sulfate ABC transporter substrate-binding protein [Comamonas sp. NLF-1-9]QXL84768.1 sulfate ABC transporter substrate-binding protein [Comamonas sp. NLF-1-9]